MQQFVPLSVIFNHGTLENQEALEERAKKELGIKKTGVIGRGLVYRVNSYGIDKAIEK